MCGRLACSLSKDEIITAVCKNLKTKSESNQSKTSWIWNCDDYKPFFNGPPTTNIAVLLNKHHFKESESEFCIATMKWGLLPHYATEAPKSLHTHNARFETIMSSPLYSPCLKQGRRCVILTEGYYEWQTKPGINNKQPFFFYQEPEDKLKTEKTLIKLAGIFNKSNINGEVKYSCTIITKESDETLAWVHHRMPIFLNTQEEIQHWLDSENYLLEEALNFISDVKSHKDLIKHYPVKPLVNKVAVNTKECMEKITLKRKSNALTNWLVPKKSKH